MPHAQKGLNRPLLMPGVRLDRDASKARAFAERVADQPWLAGYCVFGGTTESVAQLISTCEARAGRPLLWASDLERGVGQQMQGGATHPDLGMLGLSATEAEVETLAQHVAFEARTIGINVLFAPVLDVRSETRNPIVGARSFGFDTERVASLGAAYVRGALKGGALPVGKHWPGHGPTSTDSHDDCPVVTDDAATLTARDIAPFAAAIEAGCPAFMTAHVCYPTLDPSGVIATFSRSLVDRARTLAPESDGIVLFTDALLMAGALEDGDETEAARRALEAGCDVLLYPEDPERVAAELLAGDAMRSARLIARAVEAEARLARIVDVPRGHAPAGSLTALTREITQRTLAEAHVTPAAPGRIVILDDDASADHEPRGAVLAACAAASGRAALQLGPADTEAAPEPGDTLVVFASVRAWKGAAGVSAGGQAVLERFGALAEGETDEGGRTIIWCTPSALGPGAHVPGSGEVFEAALADHLLRG